MTNFLIVKTGPREVANCAVQDKKHVPPSLGPGVTGSLAAWPTQKVASWRRARCGPCVAQNSPCREELIDVSKVLRESMFADSVQL